MKKKNSYQKLKDRNLALMQDIRTLVHKDTPFTLRTEKQHAYRMLFEAEDMIWNGYE